MARDDEAPKTTASAWSLLTGLKLSHCDHNLERYCIRFQELADTYEMARGFQHGLRLSHEQLALMFVCGLDGSLKRQYYTYFSQRFVGQAPTLQECMDFWRLCVQDKKSKVAVEEMA